VTHLTVSQVDAAWRRNQRFAIERASDEELAAMAEELDVELALLEGDVAAGDYTLFDEPTLRNGIAYYQHQLAEVARQAERRLRARRAVALGGPDPRAELRARFDAMRQVNIVEALQVLGVPLEKRGREWWACCPLHGERSPSFAVNAEKGVWRCHGCHRGGDLVRFVMEREHLSAVEALRFLEAIVTVPGVAA
jgi:CHC2-type zinc finger protein